MRCSLWLGRGHCIVPVCVPSYLPQLLSLLLQLCNHLLQLFDYLLAAAVLSTQGHAGLDNKR